MKVRDVPHAKLIFIDETAFWVGMSREMARSEKGQKAFCLRQFYKGRKMTLIGAMSMPSTCYLILNNLSNLCIPMVSMICKFILSFPLSPPIAGFHPGLWNYPIVCPDECSEGLYFILCSDLLYTNTLTLSQILSGLRHPREEFWIM